MKVGELIEILAEYDPEMEFVLESDEYSHEVVRNPRVVKVERPVAHEVLVLDLW